MTQPEIDPIQGRATSSNKARARLAERNHAFGMGKL